MEFPVRANRELIFANTELFSRADASNCVEASLHNAQLFVLAAAERRVMLLTRGHSDAIRPLDDVDGRDNPWDNPGHDGDVLERE